MDKNLSDLARELGRKGGQKTAEKGKKYFSELGKKKFERKTKEEISEMMRNVQKGRKIKDVI